VIGRSRLQEALKDATKHAVKQFEKELSTDVASFDKDLTAAVNESLKNA
jgi:Sec-independent protein translocase protein TatA